MNPLSLITSKLAGPIATFIAVILGTMLVLSSCENGKLERSIEAPKTGWRAKLKTSEDNLSTCRGNVNALNASIDSQNHAVDALASESAARTREAERRASQARQDRITASSEATRILTARPGSDSCVSALDLIREAAK